MEINYWTPMRVPEVENTQRALAASHLCFGHKTNLLSRWSFGHKEEVVLETVRFRPRRHPES